MGDQPAVPAWKGWNVNTTPAPTFLEDVMSQVCLIDRYDDGDYLLLIIKYYVIRRYQCNKVLLI